MHQAWLIGQIQPLQRAPIAGGDPLQQLAVQLIVARSHLRLRSGCIRMGSVTPTVVSMTPMSKCRKPLERLQPRSEKPGDAGHEAVVRDGAEQAARARVGADIAQPQLPGVPLLAGTGA